MWSNNNNLHVVVDVQDVVVSEPHIEKEVPPTIPVPNAVVSERARAAAASSAVSRGAFSFCLAYLIILLCLLVFGIIAGAIHMPILAFNIIYGVLVAFGTGITVGLILSCCYVVGVVQRENAIAKNVALGNRPAH